MKKALVAENYKSTMTAKITQLKDENSALERAISSHEEDIE